MHSNTALISGAVVLFGAAAFANLLLPPATPASAPPAFEAPAATVAPVLPASVVAQQVVIPEVLELGPYANGYVPTPDSQLETLPTAAPPVVVPVAEPVVEVVTPPAATPAVKKPKLAPRRVSNPPAAKAPAPVTPVASQPAPSTPQQYSLSATQGGNAWVRIGNQSTVAVKVGDVVPGLGRITSVDTNQISIEGGKTLRAEAQP